MFRKFFAWVSRYERHLVVVATVLGIIVDQLFFGRVGLAITQAVFLSYSLVCFISIPLLHWIEARATRGVSRPRWRPLLPLATHFALGGFWSGFLVFYGRSAVISGSWPFLLFLLAILVGNELLSKYHARVVFTSTLFFFALYSYAIFAVPLYTNTIGTGTFLISTVVAVVVFALFTSLLRLVAHERFRADIWRIRIGAVLVLAVVNLFYFTGVLPPLPLSARAADIYHSVQRTDTGYQAIEELQPWTVRYLGFSATLHVVPGESLYAYSAVFAPVQLTTTIVHDWQWYDPNAGSWVTKASIAYPIVGGRDGGYKGYSAKTVLSEGRWRVNVKTIDGRLIARIPFTVVHVQLPPPEKTILLP